MSTRTPKSDKVFGPSDNRLVVCLGVLASIAGIGSFVIALMLMFPAPGGGVPPGERSPTPTPASTPTPTPTVTPTATPTPPPTPAPTPPLVVLSSPARKLLTTGGGFSGEFIRRGEIYKEYFFNVGADLTPVTITVNAEYRSDPDVFVFDRGRNILAHYGSRSRDAVIKMVFPPKFKGEYLLQVRQKEGGELRYDIRLD